MIDIRKAAIYVGTYRKYNNGSIFGAWLHLADYKDKIEFVKACVKLHKNERDPEFMYQDNENIPEPLVGESWVSNEVWTVINRLKEMSEEQVQAFYDWCEENSCEQDVKSLDEFGKIEKKVVKAKAKDSLMEEYKAEILKLVGGDDERADWYMKGILKVIKLSDGKLIAFEKPKIEKSFCFGYSDRGQGYTYDEANKLVEEYRKDPMRFVNNNLHRAYGFIEKIEEGLKEGYDIYTYPEYNDINIWRVRHDIYFSYENGCEKMKAEDIEAYLSAAKEMRKKFKKKLEAYIRRYGTKSLKIWSFWADD